MEYALPKTWGQGSRGFWTKRRKSITSLLAIIALIAGIAVAFKLFDREVPNNVVRDASIFNFAVQVQRTAAEGCRNPVQGGQWCNALSGLDPIFAATRFVQGVERPIDTFPGDKRTERVRIRNTNVQPAKDASFEMYVRQDSIVVRGCEGINPTTGICTDRPIITDERAEQFLNFWILEVERQDVARFNGQERYSGSSFSQSCRGTLRELSEGSPCPMGTVRRSDFDPTGPDALNLPTDGDDNEATQMHTRQYLFHMEEEDDQSDQSWAKGWTITFTFVFQARLPALPDPDGLFSQG